ncbi:MAG: hypothetical protein ACKV2V_29055 [Blastocatellia bacterium]
MRLFLPVFVCLAVIICSVSRAGAQTNTTPAPGNSPNINVPNNNVSETSAPLRRVTLYRHGAGYFERRARVRGDQRVNFSFDAAQMNDVLISLAVLDLDKGNISSVSFDTSNNRNPRHSPAILASENPPEMLQSFRFSTRHTRSID